MVNPIHLVLVVLQVQVEAQGQLLATTQVKVVQADLVVLVVQVVLVVLGVLLGGQDQLVLEERPAILGLVVTILVGLEDHPVQEALLDQVVVVRAII